MEKKCCVIICGCLIVIVLGVTLGLVFGLRKDFKTTFIDKCEKFPGRNAGHGCQNIWSVFERAYIGKDPCKVPVEAYDPLIYTVPVDPPYDRMMFWSKTKNVASEFATTNNYVILDKTLLGNILDGLTWCGKEGSSETFTTGCPGRSDKNCLNNPVHSFWNRASAAFADGASGQVTAMLNGAIDEPYDPTSVFARIEVKRLNPNKVNSLNVFLVNQKKDGASCDNNQSLRDLRVEVQQKGITYSCNRGDRVWLSHVLLLLSFLSISTS
ncbi:ADP-ribosyl cyclase/cyclic ADP-ribose hydrolase 1-like [Polymixia lowei]